MSKKTKYVMFLIVTLIYVFFEVTFRLEMLDISTAAKDNIEIQTIEMVGRFLSSLGFMIFLISNIKLTFKNKLISFFTYILIAFLSFLLFFQTQTYIINNIGENFNEKEKSKMVLLQMDKELIYSNQLSHKDFNFSNKNSAASKILIAFYPFIRYEDPIHNNILSLGKNLITEHAVKQKWNNNVDNFDIMMKKERELLEKIYVSYYNTKVSKSDLYPFSKRELELLYIGMEKEFPNVYGALNTALKSDYKEMIRRKFEKLKNKNIIEKFISNFSFYLTETDNIEESINRTLYTNLFSDIFNFDIISGTESNLNNYTYPVMADIIKIKDGQYDYNFSHTNVLKGLGLLNPSLFNQCKAITSNKKGFIVKIKRGNGYVAATDAYKSVTANVTEKQFKEFYNRLYKTKQTHSFNQINCNFNKDTVNFTYNKVQRKFMNSTYFKDNNEKLSALTLKKINASPKWRVLAFASLHVVLRKNDKNIYELLNKNILHYNQYFDNLDYSSKDRFVNSIAKLHNKWYSEKFYKKVKDNGFNLDFLRGIDSTQYKEIEDFYEIPKVKKILKKNLPFFINNKDNTVYKGLIIKNINNQSYLKSYSKYKAEQEIKVLNEVLSNPYLMKKGEKYEALGNDIAKSFVAIPFVLSISTVMIFLTLLNIVMKTISLFIVDNKKILMIKISLLLILSLLPALTPNEYSNNQNITTFIETKTNKYFLFWFQNTQILLESVKIDNKLTNTLYLGVKSLSYMVFVLNGEDINKIKDVKDKLDKNMDFIIK
jgi:hypothetical protein